MSCKNNQSNRVYLHDVITEKATLSFNTEPTTNSGEGIRDKDHLYITSIIQNALNVKGLEKNHSKVYWENLKRNPHIRSVRADEG